MTPLKCLDLFAGAGAWVTVPGFPDYEVSGVGQIRRVTGGRGARAGHILSPHITPAGYRQVALRVDGKTYSRLVCQIVCEAVHGPRPEGMEVRHLDGDPLNDTPANLAWGTHFQNMQDIKTHGTHRNSKKTHCIRGHEFTEANTVRRTDGGRWCRSCKNAKSLEWKRKRKATINA